ncbi:hypothetical protein GGE68_002158 [Rhizobium leguminosarum]|uniref:hypothetical protein n=1 Tax=Rhizobium leguminosarum TaxID=384 RepID=UPI001790B3ED|nr:hypothetical protein [Rhizobium leguminosarum]MBB5663968.1 hypothetical protein [Rhizobium leguminosarum]
MITDPGHIVRTIDGAGNATGDECTEREFLNEEFAQNYAAGQALRLHAIPEKSPISAKR